MLAAIITKREWFRGTASSWSHPLVPYRGGTTKLSILTALALVNRLPQKSKD